MHFPLKLVVTLRQKVNAWVYESVTSNFRSEKVVLKMPRKELLSKTINNWLVANDVISCENRHFGLVLM